MAATKETAEVQATSAGFAMGVNIRDAVNTLQPEEARRLENGILDERGGFSKRLGCQNNGTVGVGADRILSIFTFYRVAAAPQMLIHTSAGNIYYTNDPTAASVVWTLVSGGFSTTQPASFEQFNGVCFFSDGTGPYSSWDGATYTSYPSAPKGRFLRIWKDIMWVSGVTNLWDRVYASAPGDATTFPVASWVDIAKGDGDQVTALGTDGTFLVVWKRRITYVISDPNLFTNHISDAEKGCESHFSVVHFEQSMFFLSRRGICEWQGDSSAKIVSYKIDPLFDPAILNLNLLNLSWAFTIGNRVSWTFVEAGGTVATLQVDYYPRLAMITAYGIRGIGPFAFNRMPGNCFAVYRNAGVERLFGGHPTANKFMWFFAPTGTDDGVAFAATLETGAYDFGAPLLSKYIRRIRFLGRGRLNVQIKPNFKSAVSKTFVANLIATTDLWTVSDLWDVAGTWGPDSNLKEAAFHPDVYGRWISLLFTDSETAQGSYILPVGSRDYSLPVGEWSVLGFILDGYLLGNREA